MSRAIKIINEIPSNKAGIKLFAEALVQGVLDGNAEPLEMRAKMDAIEKIIKEVKDSISFKDCVLDECDKYPEKTFEHNGVKFTKAESAKYDYSDDPMWTEAKFREEEHANARRGIEKMLRTLEKPTKIEGVLRYPPSKKATTYVRLTFEK